MPLVGDQMLHFHFFFFCLSLIVFKIYCLKLFIGAVMQENLRFASSGDDIKIWDASSMTLVDKFNPHTSPHGISSMCWSSNSILFVFLNNHFCQVKQPVSMELLHATHNEKCILHTCERQIRNRSLKISISCECTDTLC